MLKRLVLPLCLVFAACSPPGDESVEAPGLADAAAQPAAGGEPAGARQTIETWANERYGPNNVFSPVDIFYGDYTGDGAPDALAWVLYSGGGNSAMLDVALFRGDSGRMLYHRSVEAFGESPRDVVFATGRITLTSTMPRPGDPRCCPTGSQDWTIETD